MTKKELNRLIELDKRIQELVKEFGLLTTEVDFEVTTAQRVLEGMSYMFPTNFSHWSFGRDFEKHRTIYEHTGSGIPYEQVWNFDRPKAFLVETNPLALNALILAHVYGHVDFFLGSRFLQHSRTYSNVAEEARNAAERFRKYEERHGQKDVETIIDAGMSIQWHQNPDPFFQELDEETVREQLLDIERAKLERFRDIESEFKKPETRETVARMERKLEILTTKTPPEPTYDLLGYIIQKSPKPLKPWMLDVLRVIRNQARCLNPNRRIKMLNEGWASYWHVKIMRRLFQEGLLKEEEHGIFNDFHSGVTRESRISFNWYRIGLALFENIKERWDSGRFGKEYEEERDSYKHSHWNTNVGLGNEKIFQVRQFYSDRMAVEEFFTDEFIREQEIYIWVGIPTDDGGMEYHIAEDDPEEIRKNLKEMFTSYGIPTITVENGNHNNQNHLLLRHHWTGFELDPLYMNATLDKLNHLWGKKVFIETIVGGKPVTVSLSNGGKK